LLAGHASGVAARKTTNRHLIAHCQRPGAAYSAAFNLRSAASPLPVMNDLRLKPFNFNAAVARAGLRPDGMPRSEGVGETPGGFKSAMTQALKDVSQTQFEAQRLQRELTLDNPTVSLEETMMAMQKSQIGFQAVLQVRNRLAQAYTDIMNMQV